MLDDIFEVQVESYDSNGYGVCHINKKVIFILGALINEKLKIKIISDHKN